MTQAACSCISVFQNKKSKIISYKVFKKILKSNCRTFRRRLFYVFVASWKEFFRVFLASLRRILLCLSSFQRKNSLYFFYFMEHFRNKGIAKTKQGSTRWKSQYRKYWPSFVLNTGFRLHCNKGTIQWSILEGCEVTETQSNSSSWRRKRWKNTAVATWRRKETKKYSSWRKKDKTREDKTREYTMEVSV